MIRLGVLLVFVLPTVAFAGMRDDAAEAGSEGAKAISNYMSAWTQVQPIDCSQGAPVGEHLARDMVGAVDHLSDELNEPNLDTRRLFVLTERLGGVAPYAAQGQLSLAEGYSRARCYAKAREAYQVVVDTFADKDFSVYRQQALTALKRLPPG